MATITISKNSNVGYIAKKADTTFVVDADVTISSINADAAFDARSGHDGRDIIVRGTIAGSMNAGTAIAIGNQQTGAGGGVLFIAKSADLTASTAIVSYADHQIIENRGTIHAAAGLLSAGEGARITNAGLIDAVETGVMFGFGSQTLVNDGSIVAGQLGVMAMFVAGETGRIVNNGEMTGGDCGIISSNGAGGRLIVTNYGTITGGSGAIATTQNISTEVIRNRGDIAGNVSLGLGNDTYDGRGGTLGGIVSGGEHNDIYVISNAQTSMVEAVNEGFDTVKTEVNWTLGSNFENLALIGHNDLSGTGNALANTISGNGGNNLLSGEAGFDILRGGAGNDSLMGGAQSDIFVFAAGGDKDSIVDFQDGSDMIDLRAYETIKDFGDVSSLMKQFADGVRIYFGDGDLLHIAQLDKANLSGADFLFS